MKKQIAFLSLVVVILATGCKKDPADPNEQEQITKVLLNFVNVNNSADAPSAFFSDADGDGGNAPTQTELVLADSSVYEGTILLLDESKSPVDTISNEVLAEGDEHQLFYTASSGLGITTQYQDQDGNGDPIGLSIRITTTTAATGTYKVVLKHQPNGEKDGQESSGETDVEVLFNVRVEG